MSNSTHVLKSSTTAVVFSACVLLSTVAWGQGSPKEAFAQKAAYSNMFELETAKLAITRGRDEAAKQFARDMVMDHTKASADLESAAKEENITLPTSLDDEDAKKLAALKNASETDFDQAYLSTQVSVHEEAVALFTAFAKDGPDGSLKNFASHTIGTLRTHAIKVHGLTNK